MIKKSIQFSHANGFPSPVYQHVFSKLKHIDLNYIECIGIPYNGEKITSWDSFVDDLIRSIEQYHHDSKVVGIGHSLGGVVTYIAAHKRPDLFEKVIILDAPISHFLGSSIIRLLKITNLINYVTPAHLTLNRTHQWPSLDHALEHFKLKKKFARFHEHVLMDYVTHGTLNKSNNIELKIDRNLEYQIYRTIPNHLHQIRVDSAIDLHCIYGQESTIMKASIIKFMENTLKFSMHPIQGSHLFPFEHPQHTAEILNEIIHS